MHPVLSNTYLILIFIGILLLLLKLHDLKGILKVFISELNILATYVNALEEELRSEEDNIAGRVEDLSNHIIKIREAINRKKDYWPLDTLLDVWYY